MAYTPKYLAVLAASALAATAIGAGCSQTDELEGASSNLEGPSQTLVISQVYGGGGGPDAPFKHDYIELFNKGTMPVKLAGKALQFAPAADAFGRESNVLELKPSDPNFELQPGQYFLVQLKSNGDVGAELAPKADIDASGDVGFDVGNQGKIALLDSKEAALGGCGGVLKPGPEATEPAGDPQIAEACMPTWIDFVGYGSKASQAEGTKTAGHSNKKALFRKDDGCLDSNDNDANFKNLDPSPRTSAKTREGGACEAAVPGTPTDTDAGEAGTTPVPTPEGETATADTVRLNEILINPPGSDEAPWEFVEIACKPGTVLKNFWFVAVEGDGGEGDAATAPGKMNIVIDLSAQKCGANGLLLIKAKNGGHASMASGTTVLETPIFDRKEGPEASSALQNATTSFLIVKSELKIEKNVDYDPDESGTLRFPDNGPAFDIVDGVATFDQKAPAKDVTYAKQLAQKSGFFKPDGASRIPGKNQPNDPSAWYSGTMKQAADSKSLVFDPAKASANFPAEGFSLTPGAPNNGGSSGSSTDGQGAGDGDGDGDGLGTTQGSPSYNPPGEGGKERPQRAPINTAKATNTGSRSACSMTNGPAAGSGSLAALGALGLALTSLGRRRRK